MLSAGDGEWVTQYRVCWEGPFCCIKELGFIFQTVLFSLALAWAKRMQVWNFEHLGGGLEKRDAWLDASLVAGLKIIVKGLRLTILPEQPAWQWVIRSLMWKLENWQTNLQEGNWISRETNGRPCGWMEFIRCKGMQGSCHPPLIPACKTDPCYLFVCQWKARVPWSWCLLWKWMDSILSNDVFEMEVTSLTVTGIYYQFPPYLNKTGITPPGPTWLPCFLGLVLAESQFLGGSGIKNKSGKSRDVQGNVMRNGKCLPVTLTRRTPSPESANVVC